jgi:sortase (surface protein transpeptidase)
MRTSALALVSKPLADLGLDLRAPPVEVSLELRIPSLRIRASVLAVGITPKNLMDAPKGLAGDPVWQKAFWYRGSAIPGDPGTATIAGHVTVGGRPALFARLKDLRPGDLIIVHDTRSGLDARFIVTEMQTYSVQQAADPSVLARVYGTAPVAGKNSEPAPEGRSRLTLITCSGSLVRGSYDHRLVVYAQRVQATVARTR